MAPQDRSKEQSEIKNIIDEILLLTNNLDYLCCVHVKRDEVSEARNLALFLFFIVKRKKKVFLIGVGYAIF